MNKIRELRKEKGLTLDGLSKELQEKENLKIGSNALGKYERGLREPKLKTWQALAKYFDVPIAYLQGVSTDKDIRDVHIFSYLCSKILTTFSEHISSKEIQKDFEKYDLTNRDINSIKQGVILSSEIVNKLEKEYTFFNGSRANHEEIIESISDEITNILLNSLEKIKDGKLDWFFKSAQSEFWK